MPNIIEEFYNTLEARQRMAGEAQRQRLQELTTQSNLETAEQGRQLGELDLRRGQREFTPGSLEDITRRAQTAQAGQTLEDIDIINQEAQRTRQLEALKKQTDLVITRIKSGEDGQKVLEESNLVPKGTKYTQIEVVPGIKVPGMLRPGETQPEFLDDKDEQEAIAHARRLAIEKAAKTTTEKIPERKRPDTTTIDNIVATLHADQDPDIKSIVEMDSKDEKQPQVRALATLIANRTQTLSDDNPAWPFELAEEIAYDQIIQERVSRQTIEKGGGFLGLFDRTVPASVSKKPIQKSSTRTNRQMDQDTQRKERIKNLLGK